MSEVWPGYKQTDVGAIPDEWAVEPLGALIGSLDAGVSVRSTAEGTADALNSARVLKTSCISLGRFFANEAKPILSADIPRAMTTVHGNTILISRMNTPALVGEVGYVDRDYPDLFLPDRLWMARAALGRKVSMRWLTAVLAHGAAGQVLRETATGTSGSMKNISKPALRGVLTPTPPPAEQQAIAGALGDADALIEALGGLLAKKRSIKQGAMQDLLTGHRRLPGFEGEWPRVSLGSLYDFKNGLNKGREYFGVGRPIVNYMDVFRSPALSMAALHGRVTVTPDESRAYGAQLGDVFFTRTSETQEEIGMTSVMLDQPSDCVFSGFLLRARPKSAAVARQYARYCFRPYAVRQQIIARSSYTTRALTNGRALSMVELDLPEPQEQRAIAAVLSDMDAEIAALEGKLAKHRAVKQGMMQVLLTGEIRLV